MKDLNFVNDKARDDFIVDHQPFILSVISKTTGRYITSEDSDEYSVGLSAFNEAIERYEASRGTFIAYAELIIDSRIKDYLRANNRYTNQVIVDDTLIAEMVDYENNDLKLEIDIFENALKEYGITFEMLVDAAPKHKKTVKQLIEVCSEIVKDASLVGQIRRSNRLPMKRLSSDYNVSKRQLVRFRSYIISLIVIESEGLNMISGFIERE